MEEARIVFEHVYRGAGPPQATDLPVPQRPVPAAPSDAGDGPADLQSQRMQGQAAAKVADPLRALPNAPAPTAPPQRSPATPEQQAEQARLTDLRGAQGELKQRALQLLSQFGLGQVGGTFSQIAAGAAAGGLTGATMAAGAAAFGVPLALQGASQFSSMRANRYAAYSPELAAAMAQNEVAGTYRDLRAARELGPLLAENERARGRSDRAWQDLQDEVSKLVTPASTAFEETKEGLFNLTKAGVRLLNEAYPDWMAEYLGQGGVAGPVLSLIGLGLRQFSGEDEVKAPDVFGWWASWPHLSDVPGSLTAAKLQAMIAKGVLAGGSEGRPASVGWEARTPGVVYE